MRFIFFINVFLVALCVNAQNNDSRLELGPGYMARTTFLYYKGIKKSNQGPLSHNGSRFIHEAGIHGTGFNIFAKYRFNRAFSLRYESTFRYDVLQLGENGGKNRKTFYIDQNFSLLKYISTRIYFGVGYSIINIGKSLHYFANNQDHLLPLEFDAYNIHFGYKLPRNFTLESTYQLIPDDFPKDPDRNINMIKLAIYYPILGL